jgi:hypothetical protein
LSAYGGKINFSRLNNPSLTENSESVIPQPDKPKEHPVALARKSTVIDVFRDKFHLTGPFRIAEIYNPDNPGLYVREMYSNQLDEFHQKFFVDPLERELHQTIGAVWSSHSGDSEGRGFGKSMMMSDVGMRLACTN